MTDQLYETLKRTSTNHIRAFEDPDPFNPEQIYEYRAEGCIMHFHPSNSLGPPFNDENDVGWELHAPVLRMLGDLMSKMKFKINGMVIDVKERTVATRLQGFYDFKAAGGEPEVKNFMIEYAWFTRHNESGDKIIFMDEFLDHTQAMYMIEKAQVYAKENPK